jgi:hypothetical protein
MYEMPRYWLLKTIPQQHHKGSQLLSKPSLSDGNGTVGVESSLSSYL